MDIFLPSRTLLKQSLQESCLDENSRHSSSSSKSAVTTCRAVPVPAMPGSTRAGSTFGTAQSRVHTLPGSISAQLQVSSPRRLRDLEGALGCLGSGLQIPEAAVASCWREREMCSHWYCWRGFRHLKRMPFNEFSPVLTSALVWKLSKESSHGSRRK